MAEKCCGSGAQTMILACSGRSNLGQLANQAALELTREGFGNMFCLAGIGGHIPGFVKSAKSVPDLIAIDGCEVGCVKAILEHVGVPLRTYLVLTDTGIPKKMDFELEREEIERVKQAIRDAHGQRPAPVQKAAAASAPCCG